MSRRKKRARPPFKNIAVLTSEGRNIGRLRDLSLPRVGKGGRPGRLTGCDTPGLLKYSCWS